MDTILKKTPVSLSRNMMDCREECGVSGEFTLPDYCPDIAVVLKCQFSPCLQNRQWSGEHLLVDGAVNVRVLYLDEDRCAVRSVEFPLPFSCSLRRMGQGDMPPVELRLTPRYANCRAISPRRLEVRGAITVRAKAETVCEGSMSTASPCKGLYTKHREEWVTYPIGMAEKMLTISESLEFPENLPGAEMLLGGECRAVVRECKLLSGKAIVKGQLYLHQLYTDHLDRGTTHCLDFVLPFSQILDVETAGEGVPYRAWVNVLSDTERCTVGPDGENTILDVSVKLLVQMQIYGQKQVPVLTDAYHTQCPISLQTEEVTLCSCMGSTWENTMLPMQMALPTGHMSEIVDVWVQCAECDVACRGGVAELNGRMSVCVLARDKDGQIFYVEQPEDYRIEYPCCGNEVCAFVTPTELRYRTVEDKLELQVGLCVELQMANVRRHNVVREMAVHTETPYPTSRAGVLLYYADAGETVWEIGNRCHTSPECICAENDLTDEVLVESKVLVVPIVS